MTSKMQEKSLQTFLAELKQKLLTDAVAYQNTILIVIDGMGYHQMKNIYPCDFLKTCLPSSTVPATTLLRTGLSPEETGLYGWSQYFHQTNEIVEVFTNTNITNNQKSQLPTEPLNTIETITTQLNKQQKIKAFEIMQFFNKEDSLDAWSERILTATKQSHKKYIYAYWYKLDSIAHTFGVNSKQYQHHIKEIFLCLKTLMSKLPPSTEILITADHGLIDTNPIFIDDYPEIASMLETPIFLEPRYTAFKVKKEFRNIFEKRFNIDGFKIEKSKNEATGDFIAIAVKSYALYQRGYTKPNKAEHGSITKEEQDVPLLRIYKK